MSLTKSQMVQTLRLAKDFSEVFRGMEEKSISREQALATVIAKMIPANASQSDVETITSAAGASFKFVSGSGHPQMLIYVNAFEDEKVENLEEC